MAGANSNIQVTELDFNNIKNNLKTYLQSQDVLKDYNYEGSALSTLLDILAYNTQYNAYYLNMVANEMFLDTALQRSSVVSHAKELNYTPKSTIAPTSFVNVTVNQVTDTSLTLPKFTNFMSEAIDGVNYNFVTIDSTTVNVSGNTAIFNNVELKQGIPVTLRFTVDSATNPKYTFEIPDANADTTSLKVTVQNSISDSTQSVYTLSTNYLSLSNDSQVYFLQENVNGNYEIYFGNGILGKQLVDGNVVIVSYIVTQGSAAAGANNFVLMDTIQNYSNTSIQGVVEATQGSPRENITSIKFQAPKSYAAQNRAVTKEDYITAIQQNNLGYSFDAVNVWGGQENDPPVYGQVYICVKPSGAYNITDTQKTKLISDVIRPISMMTVEPVIVDADYTYVKLTVNVLYDSKKTNRTSNQLQTAIKSQIMNLADSTLNTFNSTFKYSDFVSAVNTVDNSIITNDISVEVQKKFSPNLSTPTTYTLNYGVPIKRGVFSSSVNSSPAVQFRNPINLAEIINGIYIEEVPASTGSVDHIIVTNPGYSYDVNNPPTATILGDGTGATAQVILSGDGRIKSVQITNGGTGYTSAILKIINSPNDKNGALGAGVVILQGATGTLRSYYNNVDYVKTIFNSNVGSVNYSSGVVSLNSFGPIDVNNPLGLLTITAIPESTIISSSFNRIITIDPYDPESIVVNVMAKT